MENKCTIDIDLGNESFEEKRGLELARIFRELANKLELYSSLELAIFTASIRDGNGNTCGQLKIT